MKDEKWVDVEGYEGLYKVSNTGNVASYNRKVFNGNGFGMKKGRMLKQQTNNNGYKYIIFSVDGLKEKFYVHRLVAMTFIQNEEKLPFVNHIDSNPLNNKVGNLEWITHKGNVRHAIGKGRFDRSFAMTNEKFRKDRESKMRAVMGICTTTGKVVKYKSIQEAGRSHNNRAGDICKVCKGERKTAQGYTWKYISG